MQQTDAVTSQPTTQGAQHSWHTIRRAWVALGPNPANSHRPMAALDPQDSANSDGRIAVEGKERFITTQSA